MTDELIDALGLRESYDQGHKLLAGLGSIEAESEALLDRFHEEVKRGLWLDEGKIRAFTQGRQQHALRAKAVKRFIAAHDNKHDLPLMCWPVVGADTPLPAGEAILELLMFFDTAEGSAGEAAGSTEGNTPPFWTVSLLREA